MSEEIIGIFEKWMKFVKLPLLTSLFPLFQKTSFTQEAWMIEGTKQMFISLSKKFYWNIIDLQYCVTLVHNTVDQLYIYIFIIIQLLSRVWLFATPWIAACQASLSFTISWSLFRLMSICPLFFRFFSHIDHYRVLSRVPCAAQYVLISYLFYT